MADEQTTEISDYERMAKIIADTPSPQVARAVEPETVRGRNLLHRAAARLLVMASEDFDIADQGDAAGLATEIRQFLDERLAAQPPSAAETALRLLMDVPAVRQVMNPSGKPHVGNCGCSWCAAHAAIRGSAEAPQPPRVLCICPSGVSRSDCPVCGTTPSSFEDPIYSDVLRWTKARKTVTVVQVQRAFRLGYNRSAHLVERMARENAISGPRPDNTWRVAS